MDFKELINSPVFNSSRVRRYSGLHLVEEETLTDHICEMSILCLLIYKDINLRYPDVGSKINLGKLMERAVVHDLEETITNDIPRPVKYSIPEMKTLMDKVSEGYMKLISKQVGVDLMSEWKDCKDSSPEGYIIKTADMILVARKAYREVALKSNNEMIIVLQEVVHYMRDLRDNLGKIRDDSKQKEMIYILQIMMDLILEAIHECDHLLSVQGKVVADIKFMKRV